MQHPLPSRSARALSTLFAGGTVLLPTANLWQLVAAVDHPPALQLLLTTCATDRHPPELIFPDLETLFDWCPRIHPKLHTLLAYHRRPLTVRVPAGPEVPLRLIDQRGEVAARLAHDSFVYRLCEDLEAPLVAALALARGSEDYPVSFGKVRSDVLRAAEFTVQRRQREVLGDGPVPVVRMEGGELVF